jgi:hypothetical protein
MSVTPILAHCWPSFDSSHGLILQLNRDPSVMEMIPKTTNDGGQLALMAALLAACAVNLMLLCSWF